MGGASTVVDGFCGVLIGTEMIDEWRGITGTIYAQVILDIYHSNLTC